MVLQVSMFRHVNSCGITSKYVQACEFMWYLGICTRLYAMYAFYILFPIERILPFLSIQIVDKGLLKRYINNLPAKIMGKLDLVVGGALFAISPYPICC